jgi:thiol-disulfide isomerase/thioredoxin
MKTLAIVLALFIAVSSLQAQKSSVPVLLPISENGFDALRAKSKGKILLLSFWATWCLPCIKEFPDLLKLQKNYADKVDVVFVSIDDDAKAKQKVNAFLKKHKVTTQSYIKDANDDEHFINAVNPKWSGAVPATFVYDASGNLVTMKVEEGTYGEFEAILKPILSANQ